MDRRTKNLPYFVVENLAALTGNAAVVGFQVTGEVGQARPSLIHLRVRNPQPAFLAPRTVPVQDVDDVTGAADEAEVDAHAPADAHAPVPTGSHQDHVTGLAARRKFFRRTIVCRQKIFKQIYC